MSSTRLFLNVTCTIPEWIFRRKFRHDEAQHCALFEGLLLGTYFLVDWSMV